MDKNTATAGEREDTVIQEKVAYAPEHVTARRSWLFAAHVFVFLTQAAFIVVAIGAMMTNSVDNFQRGWWVTMWYAILTLVFTFGMQGIVWWMYERQSRGKVSAHHWNVLFNSLAIGCIVSIFAIVIQYAWLANHGRSYGAPVITATTSFGALHQYYGAQALSIAAYLVVMYVTSLAVVADMYPEKITNKGSAPLEPDSVWRNWLFWGLLGIILTQAAFIIVYAGALLTNTIDNLQRMWWITLWYAILTFVFVLVWQPLAWFLKGGHRKNVESNQWSILLISILVGIIVSGFSIALQYAWLGRNAGSFGAPVINTATSFAALANYYMVLVVAIVSCFVVMYVTFKAIMMIVYPEKEYRVSNKTEG